MNVTQHLKWGKKLRQVFLESPAAAWLSQMDPKLHTTKTTGRKLLHNPGYVFIKAALHTHKGTEDQGHVEESDPDPAAPRPIPGDRSAQETLVSRNKKEPEAQWQVGDPKLGTQSNGAPAPALPRATQHSPEPQGPGVTVTLSQEQLPGSPHTAQGHSGAAPDLPREESRGEKPKAEQGRDQVLCGAPRVGSRAECACLAMPDAHQCSLACFIIQFCFSG